MSLFDWLKKKSPAPGAPVDDGVLRQRLVDLVLNGLRDKDNRIRVEDAVSAAATIVGERCIDAAGDFPLRDHELTPGSRAFSTKANVLISGDVPELDRLPKESIAGILRAALDQRVYPDNEFPSLTEVYKGFAARIGKAEDWGKVPLSIPESHWPFMPPLQAGYLTRAKVDEILAPVLEDKARCLRIATEALANILMQVQAAMDHRLVLALAIETINGMAKTAPMTEKAMRQAQQQGGTGGQ